MTVMYKEIEGQVRAGQCEQAAQALTAVAETEENRAELAYLRGYLAECRSEWEEALAAYELALELDQDHTPSLFRAAQLYDRFGVDDRAVELYERCTIGEAAPVHALVNLSVLYEERGQLDEARACLESVLGEYPTHTRARHYLRSVKASYDMYYDEKTQRDRELRDAILDIPVSDFELSVRSRNCLKQMNIRTLGDLLRITEAELLTYKNFGETSLNEIKAMLSQKGLRLGQAVQGLASSLPTTHDVDDLVPHAEPEVRAITMRSVSELELSVRARRCLQRLGISTIGELIACRETELISMKNFGQTSLGEIKRQLTQMGLSLRGEESL